MSTDLVPDLSGQWIDSIRSRYALKMRTSDGWELVLAGDTTLTIGDNEPIEVDTEVAQDEPVAAVRPLIGSLITGLEVTTAGALEISLGAARLFTAVGDDHEAWQISDPNGERYICMPGGDLATWGPRGS